MKKYLLMMVAMLGMATQGTWAQGIGALSFMTHAWDDTQKKVTTTFEDLYEGTYTELSGSHPVDWVTLEADGKYVVTENATYKVLNVMGTNAHLYLCDGVTLNVKHIKLEKGYSLHIHAQSSGSSNFGKLVVNNNEFSGAAGIGGGDGCEGGSLYVYDGVVTANGGTKAAGIGGGQNNCINKECSINIYGGTVKAYGNGQYDLIGYYKAGAGIGGGDRGEQGGDVNIYGGTVTAEAKAWGASGIGGGYKGNGGKVNIFGGKVTAIGFKEAGMGIGPGSNADYYGFINITGGTIDARGVYGISGSTTISGGTVTCTTTISGNSCSPFNGELTFGGNYTYKVTKGSNGTTWESTPVAYADRKTACFAKGRSLSVKIEPCENHHYVDYICAYCSKEYFETATGTWQDEGIRASEFSNIDETNKIITITNEAELGLLDDNIANHGGNEYKGYTILLAKDLDMSAHKWAAGIGTFRGTFDGQGHTISGLVYSMNSQNNDAGDAGLIAHNDGTIKNVKIANSIIIGKRYVGAIAGENMGTVENCYVGADVSVFMSDNEDSSKGFGGIVGLQIQNPFDSSVKAVTRGCYSEASVNATNNVGGIVGQLKEDTELTDCVSKATVNLKSADGNKGIIVGVMESGATLKNNGYISETIIDNANGARLINVSLSDDLEAAGHTLNYGGPVKEAYNVSGIRAYFIPEMRVADKWYVQDGGHFEFNISGSQDDVTYCYVTVNGTVFEPAGGYYTFEANNAAAKYIVDAIAFQGEGTETSPYLIQTADDWNTLCRAENVVPANDLYAGKYFKQTADIEVSQGFGVTGGPNDKAFCGTYDGDGHTLTAQIIMYNATEAIAVFHKMKGATIKNLTVDGNLLGGIHSAGIAALTEGKIVIYNCRVKASVSCGGNDGNDAHGGGFIGHSGSSEVEMWYNMFDGELRAMPNGKGDIRLGAFIGWSANNVKQYYCVEKGTYYGISDDYNKVAFNWVDGSNSGDQSKSYNLCLSDLVNNSQVEKVRKVYSDSWGLTVTITETPYETWGNGGFQTNQGNNFFIGDEIYSTKTVHFTVAVAEGKELRQVRCNDSDITPTDGVYAVDMPQDKDAVITAIFKYWSDDEFCATDFAQKDGNVIVINTPQELALLAKLTNIGDISENTLYKLAKDLDMSEHEWKPIGSEDHLFVSTFDGQGHTISGIRILGDDVNVGLFGYSGYPPYGHLNNIKLSDSRIQGRQNVGGIAGTNIYDIDNCYVDNTVSVKAIKTSQEDSGMNAGGIVGLQESVWETYPYIENCYSAATVEGDTNVGGIDGNHQGYVNFSVSEANVTGNTNVGGISGVTRARGGYVYHSVSAAQVKGFEHTGALVGLPVEAETDPYRIRLSYFISPAQKMNDKDYPAFPVTLSEELANAGATMRYTPYNDFTPYSGLVFYNDEETSVFSVGNKWYAAPQEEVNFYLDKPEGYSWTKVMLNGTELTPAEDGHYTFTTGDDITEFVITADLTTGVSPVTAYDLQLTDAWYTLDGRRLSGKPAKKGIYIFNGKKVVIK